MVKPTPLERAPESLVDFVGRNELWLKREDVHELGVFKWRSTLPVVEELVRGGHKAVVTSSTGNHGSAVAWACRRLGTKAVVFVPRGATEQKLTLLDRLGADVRVAGRDVDEAKASHAPVRMRKGPRSSRTAPSRSSTRRTRRSVTRSSTSAHPSRRPS